MKFILSMVSFLVIVFSTISFSYAEESSETDHDMEEYLKLTEHFNYKDWVLWYGADCPLQFDQHLLCSNEAKKYEVDGLAKFERKAKEGILTSQIVLAGYHYTFSKDYKKALYWAEKSAEGGSYDSMEILFDAYLRGNGVVQDTAEATKWYILAATMGSGDCKAKLPRLKKDCPVYYKEGAQRANHWMQAHKALFFSPD